jgi:hypothetical protein
MKLNKVLSVFALALAPILAMGTIGCGAEDDADSQSENVTALTNYTVNFDRMNEQYPGDVPMAKLTDPWTALVKIGDKTIPAPTHLFGDTVNIIPYSNEDGVKDAKGTAFERGDMIISKYVKPGKLGIALKMHRPEKRTIDLNASDATEMKEDFKLQDTHIEIVVGVEKAEHGQAGAITLNNPQTYEDGRFGNPTYSMIFLEPVFPGYAVDQQAAYTDNVRSMLVGFNAVTEFPGDYNGGDPLAANDPARVTEYVKQMVLAITGDETARAWFKDEANMVYCAELAFLSFSAGLIVPLNKATMQPLVGKTIWNKFVAEVKKHNKGVDEFVATGNVTKPSAFVELNGNKRVAMVRLTLAAESLKAMSTLAPDPAIAGTQLALEPLTMADIVQQFMRTHIPRQILGEALAPAQAAVLGKMKPGLLETMGMDRLDATDPRRVAVEALFDQIIQAVGKQYGSYTEFRNAIEPLLDQARNVTGPRPGDTSGSGLFVPPSLFHVAAQGEYHGLIGMQYVGHGVHTSNVEKKGGEAPAPTPVDDLDESSCTTPNSDTAPNACGGQAKSGGCYCDAACKEYGDCCADAVSVCSL